MGPTSSTPATSGAQFIATPKRLRRAHQAVAVLFFTCGFGYANWSSRIPYTRDHLGLSDQQLGFLLLSTCIGSLLAFRMATPLTHRYGSRALAFYGTAGFAALLNAAPAMDAAIGAAIALLLLGVAAGFMDVAMNTQAVEVEREKGRPILSTLHGVCSLGGLAGAGTGAAAAYAEIPLRWHILGISLPLLAAVFWAGGGLLPANAMPASARPQAARGRAPLSGVLLLLGAIGFCSSVGEGAMGSWVGVYLREDLHTSFGQASIGYACFSAAMVFGRFSCDTVSRYVPARQLVRAAGMLVATGLTLGLAINTPITVMLGAMAVGLGLSPIIPAIFRAGGSLATVPPSQALATLATMSYGGGLFGPPTIGFVAEHVGLRYGLGVVVVLAIILTALSAGMPKPSMAAADV